MPIIDLKNGFRLNSDKRQWILQKQGKDDSEGNEVWHNQSYNGTLESAVESAYSRFLRESDAIGIDEFMKDSKRIFNKMVACLSPVMSITEK